MKTRRILAVAAILLLIANFSYAQDPHRQRQRPPERPLLPEVTVSYLEGQVEDAASIPALFARNNIQYVKVGITDWPTTFPYSPDVKFGLAYTDDAMLIHFVVEEDDVRAFVGKDHGRVWTDSCVEFFMIPGGDDIYYNLECNCLGYIHLAAAPGKTERMPASPEVLAGIKRWASLGRDTFGELRRNTTWEVAFVVPYSTFYRHNITSLKGVTIKGNAFKCGGTDEYEHYLSLFPISTPRPDFHQPSFFKSFLFADPAAVKAE